MLIEVIRILSLCSALPAIFLGRHQRGILWYYVLASFSCDIASTVLVQQFNSHSRLPANTWFLTELLLIGIYFSRTLFSGATQKLFIVVTLGISAWFIVNASQHLNEKVEYRSASIMYVLFVLFCLIALYRVIRNVEHTKIEQSPLFTFSAAFLLYASYSLMLMLFADQMRQASVEFRQQIWSVHNALNLIKNLAIARVFYLQRKVSHP